MKTAGYIREVQFTVGTNNHCPIQNISKDKYIDKKTGEIKERKYYRQSVAEHLKVLAALESANRNRLLDSLKLTSTGKDYVARCVTDITVGILAKPYASDGILHRGN